MNKKIIILLLVAISLCGGCAKKVVNHTFFALDTFNDITIVAENEVAIEIEELVRIYEAMFSKTTGVDVSKINDIKNAGQEVVVTSEVFKVLQDCISYYNSTNGAFDCTIAPLMKLWGFDTKKYKVPSHEEVLGTLKYVGSEKIKLNEANLSVTLETGAMVDLGAIAKGYISDEIVKTLILKNITSGIINLGGNVYAHGKNPNGKPWKVGIQNPFGEAKPIAYVSVSDCAVVTSGAYQRYFEENGTKYHHIIDPKTGYPADSGLISVTILTKSATVADVLATACFVLGSEKGMQLVNSLEGVEALFIENDKKLLKSEGLEEYFNFKIES